MVEIKKMLIGMCLIAPAVGLAADAHMPTFTGWRGLHRDGVYAETGLLQQWPAEGLRELWAVTNVGSGYSSPVIDGDRLYVTGADAAEKHELFSAYTLTGTRIYSVPYGKTWKGSYPTVRSTPTLYQGAAYTVSGSGELVCIDCATGKIRWQVDGQAQFERVNGRWGACESPLVFEDKVIYTPCGKKAYMVAFSARDGKILWQVPPIDKEEGGYISPLLIAYKGRRQIIQQTSQSLVGIDPDTGAMAWRFTEWPAHKKFVARIVCNTPVYRDGKIFVSNGYNQGAFQVQLADDLRSVKLVWRNEDLDTHIGGFVLVKDTLYGSSWISNSKGNWVAVDWETGKTLVDATWPGHSKGCIIQAGEQLICYEESRGSIGLIQPSREKLDVISSFRFRYGAGPHWAHPVVHAGVLYVRRGAALVAYALK